MRLYLKNASTITLSAQTHTLLIPPKRSTPTKPNSTLCVLHTYNRDTRSIYGEKRNRHHALAHVLPFKFGWQSIEQRLALIPHPRVNTTSIIGESNERNNKTLEGKDQIAPQLKAQLKCRHLREKLIHLQSAVEINPKTTQHSKHKTRLIDLVQKKKL